MALEQPSPASIKQLLSEAKTYWSGYHAQASEDFKVYVSGPVLSVSSASGEPLTTIIPTTARDKADAAANHLVANVPSITIDKSAFGRSERDQADKLEQALQAIWWRATENAIEDPLLLATRMAAVKGMGCLGLVIDFSETPTDKPKPPDGDASSEARRQYLDELRAYRWRMSQSFPLRITSIDPAELYLDPGTHGESWVCQSSRLSVGEVRATFAGWKPLSPRSEFEKVEVLRWFSKDWYYYEVDGQPLYLTSLFRPSISEGSETGPSEMEGQGPWPNPLRFIPYVPFASGFGAPSGTPEERYMGLITAARKGNLFRAEAERHTQLHTIIGKMSWGAMIGPPIIGGTLDLSPGTYNEVQPNERGEIVVPQVVGFINPPTGIFAELQRIEHVIDRSTIPAVIETAESGSAESALKFVRKVQEAGVALTPLRKAMERASARVLERVLQFFDNPKLFGPEELVQVWGQTPKGPIQAEIGPRIIRGRHIPCYVQVRPALPEDEALRIQTGAALLGRGLSLEMFYDRFMRLDDPQSAVRSFYKDQITQQLIQSGLPAHYASAVLTGQASGAEGLRGFMARTMAATPAPGGDGRPSPTGDRRTMQNIGPQQPLAAVEPTPDVRTTGGQAVPPGMVDNELNMLRQLLAARAAIR